jgi:hypothetical protein
VLMAVGTALAVAKRIAGPKPAPKP